MSQIEKLKEHFSAPGSRLTSLEALRKYGIARLAARIGELRAAGYVFDPQMVESYGGAKVADYVLRCTPTMAIAAAKNAAQAVTV